MDVGASVAGEAMATLPLLHNESVPAARAEQQHTASFHTSLLYPDSMALAGPRGLLGAECPHQGATSRVKSHAVRCAHRGR